MKLKTSFTCLFLLILTCLASAAIVNRNFTHVQSYSTFYVATDLEVNPTLAPPNTTYCTGSTYTPSANIQSDWYSAQFETLIRSNAWSVDCIIPYTTQNQNQPMKWISSSTYWTFDSHNPHFSTVSEYEQFISPHVSNPPSSLEPARYRRTDGNPFGYPSGNMLFKANTTMYCKGKLGIASNNSAYNRPGQEYLGNSIDFTQITFSTVGSYTLKSSFNLTGCIEAERTYHQPCGNPPTAPVETVDFYKVLSGFPQETFSSTTYSVTVENPFSCSSVTANPQQANVNVTSGSNANVGVIVANAAGSGKTIKVTDIARNPATSAGVNIIPPLPALPQSITPGSSATVAPIVVSTPAAPGIYTLKLDVKTATTTADCSGAVKNCTNTVTIAINATPPPPVQQPDYIPLIAPSQISANTNSSFNVTITTKNIGTGNASATSTTRAKFQSTTKDFTVLALNAGLQQNNNTSFTCPPTANLYPLNVTVDLNNMLNESNETNNNLIVMVNCTPAPPVLKPDYIPAMPATIYAYVGVPFNQSATTWNNGTAPGVNASITRLNFQGQTRDFQVPSLAAGGSQYNLGTNFNCPGIGNYSINVTVDLNNNISELNETNNVKTGIVVCQQPNPGLVIDCSFISHSSIFFPGDSGLVGAWCSQNGIYVNCPALNWNTNITGGSMSPTQTASGPTPRNSTLSISPSAPIPQTGIVNITCANQGCSASCNVSLNLYGKPTHCVLAFEPPRSSIFLPNDRALVNATCFAGAVRAYCPSFDWTTDINGALMDPSSTSISWAPKSNFSTSNSVPQSGFIKATSNMQSVPMNCSLQPVSVVDAIGPDYTITGLNLTNSVAYVGQSVGVTVRVKNIGNKNATNITITEVGGDCVLQHRNLQPLIVNQTVADSTFTCACTSASQQIVNVLATTNIYGALNQTETSYRNNNATKSFICRSVAQLTCADFV